MLKILESIIKAQNPKGITFDLMQHYGSEAAFISAGGYHQYIGLNTWESKGGKPIRLRHYGVVSYSDYLSR